MGYTISIHEEGDKMVVGHNRRDEVTRKEHHISPNGLHETWIDIPIKQFYLDTFEGARIDFNERQRDKDRLIDNYLKSIESDSKKHTVYEMIIQVGNADMQPDEKLCREILKEYVDEFIKSNPTMEVIGAYYHADELEGTPHLHLDYVPVARDLKRGMSIQNSHNKAIEQLGITKGCFKNLSHAFQERERDKLENICNKYGLEVERGVCSDKRIHQEKDIYVLERQRENILKDVEQLELFKTADTLNLKNLEDIFNFELELQRIQKELEKKEKELKEKEKNIQRKFSGIDQELGKKRNELRELDKRIHSFDNEIESNKREAAEYELKKIKNILIKNYPDIANQLNLIHQSIKQDFHDFEF